MVVVGGSRYAALLLRPSLRVGVMKRIRCLRDAVAIIARRTTGSAALVLLKGEKSSLRMMTCQPASVSSWWAEGTQTVEFQTLSISDAFIMGEASDGLEGTRGREAVREDSWCRVVR